MELNEELDPWSLHIGIILVTLCLFPCCCFTQIVEAEFPEFRYESFEAVHFYKSGKARYSFERDSTSPPKDPLIVLFVNRQDTIAASFLSSEINDFISEGFCVLEISYELADKTYDPELNRSLIALRQYTKHWDSLLHIDIHNVFMLPLGHRLVRDVNYYEAGGYSYQMDIRYPIQAKTESGALIQISHNTDGRRNFKSYDKYDDSILDALAIMGYTTVLCDHYGAGFIKYDKLDWMPQSLFPAKAAVQYLRMNGQKFLIDTNKIVALGFSKGGTSAALLAVTQNQADLELGSWYNSYSSAITASVVIGAHLDLATLREDGISADNDRWTNPLKYWGDPKIRPAFWRAASATTYVGPDDAPMLLIAGEEDAHRPKQAERMRSRLKQHNIEFDYILVPGLGHKLPHDEPTLQKIHKFVDKWTN